MLQTQYTMDYGSIKAESKAASVNDRYFPIFYLDLLVITGRSLKAITSRTERFFDNITFTFKHWRKPYSVKHAGGLSFELDQRTFRLATVAIREAWFIVMHPAVSVMTEMPASRQEQAKRREMGSKNSALQTHHAHFLAIYIKWIFLTAELLGEGIEPSWKLDGPQTQKITFNKWTTFREQFMGSWNDYIEEHTCDKFWTDNTPAFHAYDYGANIEIKVNDILQTLPRETRLQRGDEESDSDSENDGQTDGSQLEASVETGGERDPPEGVDYHNLYSEGLKQLRTEME